jgi:WD40 repeat protein
MKIPELTRVRDWSKGSVGRCAAFIPNEPVLIVGKSNGQVLIYDYDQQSLRFPSPIELPSLKSHDNRTQGVAVLPGNSTIITGGSEGKLLFTNWTDRTLLGSAETPGGNFTSLHISPDGVFMSTGDSDASMSLWDLRVLDIPMLFTRPLAKALPDHLVTINELAANSKLDPSVRQSLTFIQRVLQYRFRFDIEIAEIPRIKVGEFDIEIDA